MTEDPINELAKYCYDSYSRDRACDSCPNFKDKGSCSSSCNDCLHNMHYGKTLERVHNCKNITYCYVCSYIYQYSSEIVYILGEMENLIKNIKFPFQDISVLKVCSIGCGPCSELFGLEYFKKSKKLNFNIEYTGFDQNDIWEPIHEKIKQEIFSTTNINFVYEDVFEHYMQNTDYPNVIILNYVLSDILRQKDKFDVFISKLHDLLDKIPEYCIIINDINLGIEENHVRTKMEDLAKYYNGNSSIKIHRFHFKKSGTEKKSFPYGIQHPDNGLKVLPNSEITKFKPRTECHSAQLVLIKTKI